MLDIKRAMASKPKKHEQGKMQPLVTPWGAALDSANVLPLHPNPQFERDAWINLNGWWEYAIVPASHTDPPEHFDGRILVPFSPESPLSHVGRQLQPDELLWYRRTLPIASVPEGQRCLLHFEAVDWQCRCLVNGSPVGEHVGGYLPFAFDITDMLREGDNEIALCVHDPSEAGVQLRGKQRLDHSDIWYTAQSGIWQTAWLEIVPDQRIKRLVIEADPDTETLTVGVEVTQPGAELTLRVGALNASMRVDGALEALCIHVPDPHLWSPDDPHLYNLDIVYGPDRVSSYCAFRTATVEPDAQGTPRFCLNHKPLFLRGLLDQGYWPDGLMTAPSEEALAFDIETAKALGFNMLRKHIKVESARWYYLADKLGMLVWQDMVCGGGPHDAWTISYKPTLFSASWARFRDDTPAHQAKLSADSAEYQREWTETCMGAVEHLRNHPSVVTWVLFNEGWGQFDAKNATALVRGLDPTRPIDAVSGWYDQHCGDYCSVHNYFRDLRVYRFPCDHPRASVMSEFGGHTWCVPGHSSFAEGYGYSSFDDIAAWRDAVSETLAQADALEAQGLAGFVYSQLTDIEEEMNGLLTYDRRLSKLEGDAEENATEGGDAKEGDADAAPIG